MDIECIAIGDCKRVLKNTGRKEIKQREIHRGYCIYKHSTLCFVRTDPHYFDNSAKLLAIALAIAALFFTRELFASTLLPRV